MYRVSFCKWIVARDLSVSGTLWLLIEQRTAAFEAAGAAAALAGSKLLVVALIRDHGRLPGTLGRVGLEGLYRIPEDIVVLCLSLRLCLSRFILSA